MLFKIKHPNLAKITFIFLSLLASVSICISMASKNIYPTILNMACSQTSKLASLITSKAIKNQINNDLNIDELIQVSYKEAITQPVELREVYKKQTGGRGHKTRGSHNRKAGRGTA